VAVQIGSHPLGGATDARDAFGASIGAYGKGRKSWPTLTVAGRIVGVQHFTRLMIEWRNEVARLIMWEIDKALPDAQEEF
jgi:glyceraldehyde-3-phosphate dehydrogenase (NADP+)